MVGVKDLEPIIAQCTPSGSGAIALLRLTGARAIELACAMAQLPGKKLLRDAASHTICYGKIIDAQNVAIDQVLFLVMRGPQTFTGQDTVEISCHNNPFIIQSIIERALKLGARPAENGEFTKRAVLNEKIDLVQAEAINDLIHAQTQMALKKSLEQLQGTLSSWVGSLEKELLKALALCEASFEFLDEEITFDVQIMSIIDNALSTIGTLKKQYDKQQHIRQGVRIAIIGSVNAGKSSLFNTLLGKERAIVTNIAGTTRDVIEAGVYRDGTYVTLIDTAGLRETDDVIEQEGINRSFEQAQLADIILLVFDMSRQMSEGEQKVYQELREKYDHKIILVGNKIDEGEGRSIEESLFISTKTKHNIDQLERTITQRINSLFQDTESPFLLNQRQLNLLIGLEQKLSQIKEVFGCDIAYELLSIHLIDAISHIAQLTGRSVSEAGMDLIFREFCVGK